MIAWLCAAPAVLAAGPTIREGREAEVRDLVRPHALDDAIHPGVILDGIAIGDGRIRFSLVTDHGQACALTLLPPPEGGPSGPMPSVPSVGGPSGPMQPAGSFRFETEAPPGPCADALGLLQSRVEANDPGDFWDAAPDPIRAPGEAAATPTPPDPWTPLSGLLWGLLAILIAVRCARFRGPWCEVAVPVGLFAFSVGLSLVLSPQGPGDGHLNLHGVFRAGPALEWGPAPVALLRGLGLLFSLDGGVISVVNLLAAGLTPALLYLLLRQQDIKTLPAALAAALAGLSPLLLTSAGSLNRQPLYLLCCLSGLVLAVRFLRRGLPLDLAGAGLAFALAALSRPEGAAVLLLGGLWAVVERTHPRRSLALGGLCAALAALAMVYLATAFRGSDLAAGHDLTAAGWFDVLRYSALLRPVITPTTWFAAWAAALLWASRANRRTAALALLGVLGLTLAWTATPVGGQLVGFDLQVASLRYQTLLLVPLALGLALAFDALIAAWPARGSVAAAVLAAGLALVALIPTSPALRPTVIDHEYRFLAAALPDLPDRARICVLLPAVPDLGLNDANLVSDFVTRPDLQWIYAVDGACPATDPATPSYYYRGSWCTPALDHPAHRYDPDVYDALLADCEALATTEEADPVVELQVPAVRWAWYDYETGDARLGLYRRSGD
jgi:hypothetical protein